MKNEGVIIMNVLIRVCLVLLIVSSLGCATQGQGSSAGSSGGGSSSASAAPASSGSSGDGNLMLTDEDYKRIGVKETGAR